MKSAPRLLCVRQRDRAPRSVCARKAQQLRGGLGLMQAGGRVAEPVALLHSTGVALEQSSWSMWRGLQSTAAAWQPLNYGSILAETGALAKSARNLQKAIIGLHEHLCGSMVVRHCALTNHHYLFAVTMLIRYSTSQTQ